MKDWIDGEEARTQGEYDRAEAERGTIDGALHGMTPDEQDMFLIAERAYEAWKKNDVQAMRYAMEDWSELRGNYDLTD